MHELGIMRNIVVIVESLDRQSAAGGNVMR